MKIRTGFVSNSSSASFIITAADNDEQTVVEVLYNHFMYSMFNHKKTESMQKVLADLGITYEVEDNIHTFTSWTTMYNDINDMPEAMFKIYTALKISHIKCKLKIQDEQ